MQIIRLAASDDAEQLLLLNEHFNGKNETDLDKIKDSLKHNQSEIVVVAEDTDTLVGFVCVQIKNSFCYRDVSAEITEVFVEEPFRRQGIASRMLSFAERYCAAHFPLHKFELLTGDDNLHAQALYRSLGYTVSNDRFMSKYI